MVARFSNRWQKWNNLDRQQQKLFFYSLVYLKAITILLFLFRYQALHNFLKSRVPLKKTVPSSIAISQASEIAEVVELAAKRRVVNATCLRRSMVLWYLLRRGGIDSNLRLGVRKDRSEIKGHAWVEIDGSVINDDEDYIQQYTLMDLEN